MFWLTHKVTDVTFLNSCLLIVERQGKINTVGIEQEACFVIRATTYFTFSIE